MMREPFSSFATCYDQFMLKFVDYRAWVDYLERVFEHFKVRPATILDVACGTGIPTVMLAERGYRLIGVDRSPEMLAVLEAKIDSLPQGLSATVGGTCRPISLMRADMRDFRLAQPVDSAISLYDSVNYLLTEDDLVRCFSCVRQALKVTGLFAFDMNTLYGLSECWGSRTVTREVGNIVSIWQNRFDPESRVSTLQLTFWNKDKGTENRFQEVHQERAYTVEEVRRSLKEAGFGQMHFFQHLSFMPVGPFTARMMVVARPAVEDA